MTKEPKILIVGTQPYNTMVQSRAFDSYFKQFKHENLAQIFSDARTPCKGHCCKLYQITDKRLIQRRFSKKINTGREFIREKLSDAWTKEDAAQKFRFKKKGDLFHWARKFVWNKKYWLTNELENFVHSFKPDYVFIAFSEDFFIFEIAQHFASKYNIPMILSIADDYVFKKQKKTLYRKKYLKMIDSLMKKNVFGIFESELIKNKYCSEFKIPGEVVYISSSFEPIKNSKYNALNGFYYFGNLEFGRYESLLQISNTLNEMDIPIDVHVYTADYQSYAKEKVPNNFIMHRQIPYNEVLKLMDEAGVLLLVEGFNKDDVDATRYSLSTKVGDYLCSGKTILAFGHEDTGAMDFISKTKCCFYANGKEQLMTAIKEIYSQQKNPYSDQSYLIAKKYFSVDEQSKKFYKLFLK